MAKEGPNWDGLLKWSLAHSDGTAPNRNLSEEDRRWFTEAMQSQSVDVIKRMKEITLVMRTPEQVLESQGVTPADIEDLLDELQEHVESIDMANDLHSIGGLVPLLGFLKNTHASVRAKAAEVVTTIVQNNPRSQQMVMEANGFEPLLSNFTSDPDVTVRTKALGAISSLVRHNKPGIAAFHLGNGFAALRDALGSENVRFQRKALNLIHYLLHENSSDCSIVSQLGFPRIMLHLASSEDAEVREAALRGLLELAQNKIDGNTGRLGEDDEKLKQLLEERINGISLMSPDELGAAMEERQLVDTLWDTCYNEPSSLHDKGLLVLPGEDSSPPDVASKHFEPPLRARAARPDANKNSSTENKQTPLLLGSGPASEAANVQGTSSGEVNADEPQNSST
ncbi:PREDICTED: hsp70 nucleotide exchange factor fes1-like [Populus euphratica]|uniref:Hsp70 nucleotide exchange factor fes1-like n=1 Tax=Populus euphratica TaxID=75702 RepID=A0AAJ6TAC9_POPEU|nr:PREDICTED: hsp70 nucleotide exchange factor fes1-like [Populus euphratica]XP_011007137.1 PREDICTED: hsp70 nucleotide exchange factor fes1-like [Populus euphratica]